MLIADIHFKKETLSRNSSTVAWLKEVFFETRPGHVIFLGDTTNHREHISWETLYAVVGTLLGAMVEAPWQPTIHLLVGNHDMNDRLDRTVNSASIISVGAPRIKAYPEITQTQLDGHPVLFLPYHADQREIATYLRQQYPNDDTRRDTVVFGHLSLHGALMNGTGKIHVGEELTPDTFKAFPYVFLGHFHKHARYGPEERIMYVGSPVQLSFGEAGDKEKGVVLYTPGDQGLDFRINPNAEQYVSINVEEAQEIIRLKDDSVRGKMVQVHGTAGVDKRVIDNVRKGLQEQAMASGVAPARETTLPLFIEESAKLVPDRNQANGLDILQYATEYVAGRLDWIAEDGDQGATMISYISHKSDQLSREGKADRSILRETFVAKLQKIEVDNFLGVKGKRTFDFQHMKPGVWLTQGRNGSGKTTLIEAIVWCLYGVCTRGDNLQRKSLVNEVVHLGADTCTVVVSFQNGYTIHRERRLKSGKLKLWFSRPDGTRVEKGSVKETQDMLQAILNVDCATFVSTVLLNAAKTQGFATASDERKKIIDDLLGFSVLEDYATLMSGDNTRVNSETKRATLDAREVAAKIELLDDFLDRKKVNLVAKQEEMKAVGDETQRYRNKLLEIQGILDEVSKTKAQSMTVADACQAQMAAAAQEETSARDVVATAYQQFQDVVSTLAEVRTGELQSKLSSFEEELGRLRSMQQQSLGVRLRREEEKIHVWDRLVAAEELLESVQKKTGKMALLQAEEGDLRRALEAMAQQESLHKSALRHHDEHRCAQEKVVMDMQRELMRLKNDLKRRESVLHTLQDLLSLRSRLREVQKETQRFTIGYQLARDQFNERIDVHKVLKIIAAKLGTLMKDYAEAVSTSSKEGDQFITVLASEIYPLLQRFHSKRKDEAGRETETEMEVEEMFPPIEKYQSGHLQAMSAEQQVLTEKIATLLSSLEQHDDIESFESRAKEDAFEALSRVERALERLAHAEREIEGLVASERPLIDAVHENSKLIAENKARLEATIGRVRDLSGELEGFNIATIGAQIELLRSQLTDLEALQVRDTEVGSDADEEAQRMKECLAEVTSLKHTLTKADLIREEIALSELAKSVRDAHIDAKRKHELCISRHSMSKAETEKARSALSSVEAQLAQATADVHSVRCQLVRYEERLERIKKEIIALEEEVANSEQDIAVLGGKRVKIDEELTQLGMQSRVIERWLKVWKGRENTETTSFRSFCLDRNVESINSRLQANIDILNRDINDAWGQNLSCELDRELKLVETGTGLSFYKMSEGQRKRMHLALFFAIFEVAQTRSAFCPKFLFLDEIFDALDQDGQMAVQRWISYYSVCNPDILIFMVTHASSIEGLNRNVQAGKIQVAYGRSGSVYEIITLNGLFGRA